MLHTLGEAALRSVLLAVVIQGALWLLRVRQARLLLATWTVVLAASVAMPVLPQFIPVQLPFDPALPKSLVEAAADLLPQPPLQALPAASGPAAVPVQSLAWPWLEAVYAVVCCTMLCRVLLGLGLSFRLLARAVPVWPEWAAGRRVRISRDVAGPVTIGHTILLPVDAMAWPAETRRAVLAHEQAHVARRDFAMLVVSQLNRAVFWFSPLPWWLHRQLATLSELASDEQAMAATRDRLGYAEILLEMGRRSGAVFQGPAMARPATLLHRINRILQEPVSAHQASRAQQLVLLAGAVGLSIGIAGLAYGPAPEPAKASSIAQWRTPGEHPVPVPSPFLKSEGTSPQVAAAGTVVPSSGAEVRTGTQPFSRPLPVPPPPSQPALTGIAVIQSPRPVVLASRAAPRATAKAAAAFLPPRAPEQPHRVTTGLAGSSETAELPLGDSVGSFGWAGAGLGARTEQNPPAASETRSSLAHQAGYNSLSLQSGLEGIAGSTCTGSVAVGMRAVGGVPGRPDVSPGQTVPAHAEFFRKEGGTLWVRFNAFGRPPLDLPVRFARNGMTWTGEYGIAYTVQAVGGDRLAGLASLVANDSARLDFGCKRVVGRML